jgi:anti-anti-sigma factor
VEIVKEKRDNVRILNLEGRLDTNSSTKLEEALMGTIENGAKKILVNMEKLSFISSSGLRILLMAGKKVKSTNGKLVLCSLQDQVKEVFDVAGFTMLFPIFQSREESLENLK